MYSPASFGVPAGTLAEDSSARQQALTINPSANKRTPIEQTLGRPVCMIFLLKCSSYVHTLYAATRPAFRHESSLRAANWWDFGAPGEIRTPDLLLRRQPLYPAELRAHVCTVYMGKGKGSNVEVSPQESTRGRLDPCHARSLEGSCS